MISFKKYLKEEEASCDLCQQINKDTALIAGNKLGVDWTKINFDQFYRGMIVEFEHANITRGDFVLTAKIVLAHLAEDDFYYSKLEKMEKTFKKKD